MPSIRRLLQGRQGQGKQAPFNTPLLPRQGESDGGLGHGPARPDDPVNDNASEAAGGPGPAQDPRFVASKNESRPQAASSQNQRIWTRRTTTAATRGMSRMYWKRYSFHRDDAAARSTR